MRQGLVDRVNPVLEILVFVFFHDRTKPVAVVMEEDANDGQAPQGITFGT